MSQFRVASVNALFDTLYAMCNLLMMPAENLRGAMQGDQGRSYSTDCLEQLWSIFGTTVIATRECPSITTALRVPQKLTRLWITCMIRPVK